MSYLGSYNTRVGMFFRTNPPNFYGSKINQDPNNIIDEVYKVIEIMGVSSIEKAELAAYQLKHVAHVLYEEWKDSRPLRAVIYSGRLLSWLSLKGSFLGNWVSRHEITPKKLGAISDCN